MWSPARRCCPLGRCQTSPAGQGSAGQGSQCGVVRSVVSWHQMACTAHGVKDLCTRRSSARACTRARACTLTLAMIAASLTVLASTPGESNEDANDTNPCLDDRPYDGLYPTTPQYAAGSLLETHARSPVNQQPTCVLVDGDDGFTTKNTTPRRRWRGAHQLRRWHHKDFSFHQSFASSQKKSNQTKFGLLMCYCSHVEAAETNCKP